MVYERRGREEEGEVTRMIYTRKGGGTLRDPPLLTKRAWWSGFERGGLALSVVVWL